MIQSLNPATGQLLRSFDALSPTALDAKLGLAAAAAKTSAREPLETRIFWMRRLACLLENDADELAEMVTAEMGKTLASARVEVAKCAAGCRYYAENVRRILATEDVDSSYSESYVRWDPLGVVLAVMPWNFPLWQVFRFLAPALMGGNVVLLKHASNVPQCALTIEALVRRAGFPRGSFQTLLLEARHVESVIGDPRVAAVTVTGSEAAGRAVAAQAGWLIKKTVLELGGSDAFIVMPSADIDAAVANAVQSRCLNNGQSCIAAKRFLVHESIFEDFKVRFVDGMKALKVGDPTLEDTDIGPLATPRILRDLLSQVDAVRAAGGCVLTGGQRLPGPGNYFPPTVVGCVPRTAAVCREETFGPLAMLFRITSLDDAIELANDTSFGLGASAWTADPIEQQRLAAELECGAVFFNTPVASDPRLPFGGIKKSGYGRELSAAGMREFLNAKTIVLGPARDAQPAVLPQPVAVPRPAASQPAGSQPAALAPPALVAEPVAPEQPALQPAAFGQRKAPPQSVRPGDVYLRSEHLRSA